MVAVLASPNISTLWRGTSAVIAITIFGAAVAWVPALAVEAHVHAHQRSLVTRAARMFRDGDDYVFVTAEASPAHGLLYAPDLTDVAIPGLCTRHVEGPWWEYAAAEPSCPGTGFHYTGEG
jgi:hypothetical protein